MLSTINGELQECFNERSETIQPGEYLHMYIAPHVDQRQFSGGGVKVSGCGEGDNLEREGDGDQHSAETLEMGGDSLGGAVGVLGHLLEAEHLTLHHIQDRET